MVTTRSNSENPDTMERILEMLMEDRQNRDAERQQLETCFARLEVMLENLFKHSDDGTPKGSVNKEETPKNHSGEGKIERWGELEIPIYDRESDAYSWINKLERFFQMRDILEEEKIQAVMVALDGKAILVPMSVSAFAPIANPINCPWGQKAFSNYLGDNKSEWEDYDATRLVTKFPNVSSTILIDQGEDDKFLPDQLLPHKFEEACKKANVPLLLRFQPGYDHLYYFIATFIDDHIRHHAQALRLN
ncbi:S-formylglutathione hydrolase [Glycine max]|nr:S-formylglutathione hydrolase [Glycine max]